MSRRFRIIHFIIALFVIIDGWAWWFTYKVHTAPSPEDIQKEQGNLTVLTPSPVKPIGDNYHQVVQLNGAWKYKQTGTSIGDYNSAELDTSNWHSMDIPQNWFLAGLNYHGVIWYRKSFQADPEWKGRLVQLQFDGVDYFADVWINGINIGNHEGYFQPFRFDITEHLNYDGENILAVRVESPYEEYKSEWPFRKTLIKGIFSHSNNRPGDPWGSTGQEYNTGGIWNDVSLVIRDFITINDVQISATWPLSQNVGIDPMVNTEVVLENHADTEIMVDISLEFIPKNHSGIGLSIPGTSSYLPRGQKSIYLTGSVRNPMLWWTWDRGQPNLYLAQVEIKSDGKTIAVKEIPYGFRQINVTGEWQWYLNGDQFFPRGANYISSQWLSETNEEWFKRDVKLIKDANLNFIRLPAHVEPKEFYNLMDEAGILIWQDFPLQWGYSDAPAFIDEAQKQMEEMIQLLFNHPSVAVWCVHNEGPSDMPWLADRDENYSPSQNRRLDTNLYDLTIKLDQTRFVHKNSGRGDHHIYIGWDSGQWLNYGEWSIAGVGSEPSSDNREVSLPGVPFISEFGAQALPNLDTMAEILRPEEYIYTSGEVRERWIFHNFQSIETFNIAQIDPGESIGDFINTSQVYQANLVKFAIENYRRVKYKPMQGVFYGMMTDSWPSIGFSVLDYSRQPKLGYHALKTAMQPILPSIQASKPIGLEGLAWVYEGSKDFWASIWVINDTTNYYPEAILNWRVESETGQRVTFGQIEVPVEPDTSKQMWNISTNRITEGSYNIFVTLSEKDGQILGENFFAFIILPQEDIQE